MQREARLATEFDYRLGSNIRECRIACGLSSPALGALIGKSQGQVDRYETGVNQVTVERLFAIAAALGVEPFSLIPGGVVAASAIAAARAETMSQRLAIETSRRIRALPVFLQIAVASVVKCLADAERTTPADLAQTT